MSRASQSLSSPLRSGPTQRHATPQGLKDVGSSSSTCASRTDEHGDPATDAESSARRWGILVSVGLAAVSLPLGFTGSAVALPAIAADLAGSTQALLWVNNAFMLAFGSLLLFFGALADRQGCKRWFVSGAALYAVAALVAAAAPSIGVLDLARGVQGIAAAALLSSGPAALAQTFHGPLRMRVFSVLGSSFGIGLAFGPLLAAWLTGNWGWRAFYAGLAGLGVVAMGLALAAMPRRRSVSIRVPLDMAGAVSFVVFLAALTWGVLRFPDHGWRDPGVLAALAISMAAVRVFVTVERRAAAPLLALGLLRQPRFLAIQCLAVAPSFSFVVLLMLLPLRFMGIEHHDATTVGLWMLALSGPMLVVPLLSGWLLRWWSAGRLSGVGLLICAVGHLALSFWQPDMTVGFLIAALLLIGIGVGLPWGLMDGLAVSVVDTDQAGMAAGIFNTVRVAGEGIALALSTSLLAVLIQQGWLHSGVADVAASAYRAASGQWPVLADTVDPALLLARYENAFALFLQTLAVVTVGCALVAFKVLGTAAASPRSSASRAA